jgi:alpha-methylacyl-CoA racemase
MHLADLGADVIAVERDESTIKGLRSNKSAINRGKRSVLLDLKSSAGRETVLKLIEQADVLIEGMRPGVMERLGLAPDICRARNPRLVYARMTGWGQHGPLSQAAGHDNNYLSLAGAMYHNGGPSDPPSTMITQVGDIGGGALYLMIGILSGLLNARTTEKGTVIDAAIVDGAAHMLQLALASRETGLLGARRGENLHDSSHFYATYRCADGNFVTIGSIEPQFYALLLQKLGLQDDPDFAKQWDRNRWPQLRRRLTALFATKTRDEWCALLENTDVCFGSVLSPDEAASHPHNVARGTFFERDGVLEATPAPRFDGKSLRPGAVPSRGQHTNEIMAALRERRGVWLGEFQS